MSVRPSPGSIGNAIVMSDPLGPVEAEADDRNDARPMPIHDVKDQLPPPVSSESDAEGALRSVDVLDVHDAPNGGHSVVVCNLDFAALGPAQGAWATSVASTHQHQEPVVYDGRARRATAKLRRGADGPIADSPVQDVLDGLIARPGCACAKGVCFSQLHSVKGNVNAFLSAFKQLDIPRQNLCISVAGSSAAAGKSETSGKSEPSHRTWALMGQPMGVTCLAIALGMNKRRLYNAIAGKMDARKGTKHRVAPKAIDVDVFFIDLWNSVGESMPDKFIRRGARLHGKNFRGDLQDVSETSSDEEVTQERQLTDLDRELRMWLAQSCSLGQTCTTLMTLCGMDVTGLEKRKLPPGNISGLYAQYLLQRGGVLSKKSKTSGVSETPMLAGTSGIMPVSSESDDSDGWGVCMLPTTASWTRFYTRWASKWRHILEFKHESQHAVCDECCKYKHAMHGWLKQLQSDLLSQTFETMQEYQRHLSAVTADRSFTVGLRGGAVSAHCAGQSDYLMILVDGMDQAKWRLPRFPALRTPKSGAKLGRPTVVVEAVWIVGHRLDFYLLDKDQHHDSNSIQECIALSLEKTIASLRSRSRDVPRCLILLADNTVRESKNQYMFKYMAIHVARHKFDICLQIFLRAGHTHDVLGAPTKREP